jgi:hypothetical protein
LPAYASALQSHLFHVNPVFSAFAMVFLPANKEWLVEDFIERGKRFKGLFSGEAALASSPVCCFQAQSQSGG